MSSPVPPPLPPPFPAMAVPPPALIRIEKKALIVPRHCTLPKVCLFTGDTEDLVPMQRTLYWHSPWVYLGVFAGLLIYVVLALALRKTATVQFYVTRAERTRRRWWHAANWGLFLSIFASLVLAGSTGIDALFWVAPGLLAATLAIYFLRVRLLYPQWIDDHFAALRGIPPEVLPRLVDTGRPPELRL